MAGADRVSLASFRTFRLGCASTSAGMLVSMSAILQVAVISGRFITRLAKSRPVNCDLRWLLSLSDKSASFVFSHKHPLPVKRQT